MAPLIIWEGSVCKEMASRKIRKISAGKNDAMGCSTYEVMYSETNEGELKEVTEFKYPRSIISLGGKK